MALRTALRLTGVSHLSAADTLPRWVVNLWQQQGTGRGVGDQDAQTAGARRGAGGSTGQRRTEPACRRRLPGL